MIGWSKIVSNRVEDEIEINELHYITLNYRLGIFAIIFPDHSEFSGIYQAEIEKNWETTKRRGCDKCAFDDEPLCRYNRWTVQKDGGVGYIHDFICGLLKWDRYQYNNWHFRRSVNGGSLFTISYIKNSWKKL